MGVLQFWKWATQRSFQLKFLSKTICCDFYQSSRALSVFNFISTDRGLKIGRPSRINQKVEAPKKSSEIQLGIPSNFADLYRSLHRIRFYSEFCLQFRQHGNVSIIKMWSFLKHYDEAQPGKRIRDVMFFYFINFLGAFHSKRSSYTSQYIQIYLFSWQLPIIFTKNR
jgi:hypothetical protein